MNAISVSRLLVVLGAVCCDVAIARAQYPLQPYQKAKTYSDYYKEQYEMTHAPPKTGANYTINRYYYHNPNISPYSNLVRPSTSIMPRYQTFVQPEIARRERVQQAQRGRPVVPNYSAAPNYGVPTGGTAYRDRYYGSFLTSMP